MSRTRVHGEDLTYAEEHRRELPSLYQRIGHRLDLADRDWTEFCHFCKEPLAIHEQVRDMGQDLRDKATTVTTKLARAAGIEAKLMAWRVERPVPVQRRIDELNRELRALEAAHPIVEFKVRNLHPEPSRVIVAMGPDEWWEEVFMLHRAHHAVCASAGRQEKPVRVPRLNAAWHEHPLSDGRLWRVAP